MMQTLRRQLKYLCTAQNEKKMLHKKITVSCSYSQILGVLQEFQISGRHEGLWMWVASLDVNTETPDDSRRDHLATGSAESITCWRTWCIALTVADHLNQKSLLYINCNLALPDTQLVWYYYLYSHLAGCFFFLSSMCCSAPTWSWLDALFRLFMHLKSRAVLVRQRKL